MSEESPPVCPKCSTELKEDFGITDCPECGTVCFVGMDGSVQIQGEDEVVAEDDSSSDDISEEALEDAYGDGVEPENEAETYEEFEAEDMATAEEEDLESDLDDQDLNHELSLEDDALHDEDASEEIEPDLEIQDEDSDLEEVVEDLANEASREESFEPREILTASSFLDQLETFAADSDVKDFDSDLYFDVKISGVESGDIKSELIETVADSRLDLSEEELIENFVDEEGALYLSQIPFVRLVVIYKRILHFGLKVEWLQKEIHELETEEELSEDIDDQY